MVIDPTALDDRFVNEADKYTDTDTQNVITAQLVDGQSIDVAMDSLITTHKEDADAHHNHRSYSTQFLFGNGAAQYISSALAGGYLPNNDNDAFLVGRIGIPTTWPGSTGVLKIMCAIEHASNSFSWKINVKSIDEAGEAWAGTAIITNDTTHDITGTGTSLAIQVEAVNLTGLEAGDTLTFSLTSDANNANNLYVLNVWLDVS